MRPMSTRFPAPVRALLNAFGNSLDGASSHGCWLCSFGVAMVSTVAQLWVTYLRDVAQIERRLTEIERSSTSALAFAAWNLDLGQLHAELSIS